VKTGTFTRQLAERQLPLGVRPVMFQTWLRLLFLHWRYDPALVQQTLPRGLEVDVYDGTAWIGIVPFQMRGVRPAGLPPLNGLSNFFELNLRTYVRDQEGRPGVWFYSLDADQPVAVWIARQFFHLPYYWAQMKMAVAGESMRYISRRLGVSEPLVYEYSVESSSSEAVPGSLEFFLIERYRLFAAQGQRLFTGRVYHQPYQLRKAKVYRYDAGLFGLDGLPSPPGAPDHVIYSDRVDVDIYAAEQLLD
jgi:uncharacterized protein